MKEKIKEALFNACDEIFLEWQAKLHIVSGDNTPLNVLFYDEIIDKLAEHMMCMLKEQPKLGITKLEMLDGQVADLSKVSMGPDMIKKLAEVEKYLRSKEII